MPPGIQEPPGSHGALPVEDSPRRCQCPQHWQDLVRFWEEGKEGLQLGARFLTGCAQNYREKIVLAARIIAAIENPADICVISARPYGQRAVLKFASHTGA